MTIELATVVVGSTTARELITNAFRALGAIDINEEPSPGETNAGLARLRAMVASWQAKSLTVKDQVQTGTTENGSKEVVSVEDTTLLAVGFNVSGSGIAALTRIKSIDDRAGSIMLTIAATASGIPSLTFELLPLEDKFEEGLTAMLAVNVAPVASIDAIPPLTAIQSQQGMNALRAQYFRVPGSSFDTPRKPWTVG